MNQQQQHERGSVLARLRVLVPYRRLQHSEALRLAELQANRLLELFGVEAERISTELVSELPRIEVRNLHGLPVSGSTHWENGRWIITINADENWNRRRFSLMHEFKHVLDHTTKERLYGDVDHDIDAAERFERAADYFAACLLMPKRSIKRIWFASGQDLVRCAARLGVSTRALSVRLHHLGLAPTVDRCDRNYQAPRHSARRMYFRVSRPLEVPV
jgi:Zn-dependent peptidase ImmA (M78 family)